MKRKSVSSYAFENYLLISLDLDWLSLFQKIPTFEVSIDNEKKLHLISNEVIIQ